MALKTDTISSIQPFWHIDCPVCGGDNFTELGAGGGVWCDTCNAEFRVRAPGGDAGCIVDCFIGDVTNIQKHDGTKFGWRKALAMANCYSGSSYSVRTPKIYCYRIMKEPGEGEDLRGTYCTDDRGWILSTHGVVLTEDRPEILGSNGYKHLKGCLVDRETALECGQYLD